MITTDTTRIAAVIADLQRAGKLPAALSPRQAQLLADALQKYSGDVGQKLVDDILANFQDKISSAMSLAQPADNSGVIAKLVASAGEEISSRINFALDVAQQVASGGGRYLNQQMAADEYPALELKRYFPRMVPRGTFDPDDSWPARWQASGGTFYDGRMIALKNDAVWQNLGDGAGGYTDTLGNPFPPFAFNSGFMTQEISRKEAVQLGLIDADEKVEPAIVDMAKLFSPIEDAA